MSEPVGQADEPLLDWGTAPEQFRQAHQGTAAQLRAAERPADELARERAKHADDHERIGDLRAELTFVKAGVDVDDPDGAYFARVYDGPMDPDSVRTAYARHLTNARAAAERFAAHLTVMEARLMPDMFTEADVARILRLRAEGALEGEISRRMNAETTS
jgi:hypothetical protein